MKSPWKPVFLITCNLNVYIKAMYFYTIRKNSTCVRIGLSQKELCEEKHDARVRNVGLNLSVLPKVVGVGRMEYILP